MRIADVTSCEFSPGDRLCDSRRVGHREVGGVTRRVNMAQAKHCAACGAHPLGSKRATCRVFSMSECWKQSFPLSAPPNFMFTAAFCARAH